ncbi:MAG: transcription elongation factor GreB [Gammaproteobacteria bacterium]|nr:transcription elongation factor GreB [Gammaproteobacteria bacterium]
MNTKNYVTPYGYSELQNELRQLLHDERPKIVEIVRWAAGNGDRSENGDYIYGKRRLREIDRRMRYLVKQIENAEIVNPESQQQLTRIYFGATVAYEEENGVKNSVQIVGIDEADLSKNKVSWISPLAKALFKSEKDDIVKLHTPQGTKKIKILMISY